MFMDSTYGRGAEAFNNIHKFKKKKKKQEKVHGERFEDGINMEASWLVAHTLTKWVQTPALPLTSTVTLGKKVP